MIVICINAGKNSRLREVLMDDEFEFNHPEYYELTIPVEQLDECYSFFEDCDAVIDKFLYEVDEEKLAQVLLRYS